MSTIERGSGSAIIVGVGPGLGAALVKAFAACGCAVGMIARRTDRLDAIASELRAAGHLVAGFGADAGNPAALAAAVSRAADELGPPECLVYNAAALGRDAPMELSGDELAARLMVDVVGAKVAADVVVPRLRDGHGTVLFTGGGLGLQPSPAYTSLSIGKAALRAYAAVLHEELRPQGVHVTCVTVAGRIGGGEPRFAPETIARVYVELHRQPETEWSPELVYD